MMTPSPLEIDRDLGKEHHQGYVIELYQSYNLSREVKGKAPHETYEAF
jgi:hypothetical protein